MKFCLNNASDLRKYFQHSYVKFTGVKGYRQSEEGYVEVPDFGEAIFNVDSVSEDSIKGTYLDPADGNIKPFVFHLRPLGKDTPDINYILPRKSYFNFQGRAWLLSRIPNRQYHRGITSENTGMSFIADGELIKSSLSFERLTAYVGKQAFLNFRKREDVLSYAVSRRMAVDEGGVLFLDSTIIGHVNYDKKTIVVKNELFIPDVQAVVASHGDDFKVEKKVKPAAKKKVTKAPEVQC